MGCCDSCFRPSYEDIPNPESKTILLDKQTNSYQAGSNVELSSEFHSSAGSAQEEKLALEFDTNSSVFEGAEVQQKFTNKSNYDTR
mgnify:CR=1 FL=1